MTAHQKVKRIGIQIAECPLNKILPQESAQMGTKLSLYLHIETDIGSYSIAWKQFVFIASDWAAKLQEDPQSSLKIL